MNNRELLASTLLKEVLAGNATTIADDAWKLDNIDIGDGPKSYIIRNTKKLGTVSGKFFFKRNLFRLENDKEKLIELGEYKKKYLYPMVKKLATPKKEKNYLLQMDDAITTMRQITKYVKNNYNNFHIEDDGSFVGDIPQGHMVITKGYIKQMKNNHNRNFGRQMFLNGELVQEGYFLDWPVDIYLKMKSKNEAKILNEKSE